ncbi:hypothetical protein V6N11_024968 [Hibiscus sabdariffa]|uniref:Uncharacterized protein n=1 Tax=Hibiscus sabdariffa TaxID=183260 RepID=A0ABR2QNR9_9ROSI
MEVGSGLFKKRKWRLVVVTDKTCASMLATCRVNVNISSRLVEERLIGRSCYPGCWFADPTPSSVMKLLNRVVVIAHQHRRENFRHKSIRIRPKEIRHYRQ